MNTDDISAHYRRLLAEHGDTPQAVQYSSGFLILVAARVNWVSTYSVKALNASISERTSLMSF